jgi:hypothetical protein
MGCREVATALAPSLVGLASSSRKTILVSAVLTPALLGVLAASDPKPATTSRLLPTGAGS